MNLYSFYLLESWLLIVGRMVVSGRFIMYYFYVESIGVHFCLVSPKKLLIIHCLHWASQFEYAGMRWYVGVRK